MDFRFDAAAGPIVSGWFGFVDDSLNETVYEFGLTTACPAGLAVPDDLAFDFRRVRMTLLPALQTLMLDFITGRDTIRQLEEV